MGVLGKVFFCSRLEFVWWNPLLPICPMLRTHPRLPKSPGKKLQPFNLEKSRFVIYDRLQGPKLLRKIKIWRFNFWATTCQLKVWMGSSINLHQCQINALCDFFFRTHSRYHTVSHFFYDRRELKYFEISLCLNNLILISYPILLDGEERPLGEDGSDQRIHLRHVTTEPARTKKMSSD